MAGQLLGPITVSMGLALFPDHGSTIADIVRGADQALYCAKRDGRDQICVWTAGSRSERAVPIQRSPIVQSSNGAFTIDKSRPAPRSQPKRDVDGQLHRVRLPVEVGRLVLPLLHGIERGRDQHSGAADGVLLHDVSVLVDHRVNLNVTLDPRFLREDRIFGLRRVDQVRGFHRSTDLKRAAWSGRRRRRRRSGEAGSAESATGDAAEYAADLSAWNATGDAAGNAGDEIRRSCGGVLRPGFGMVFGMAMGMVSLAMTGATCLGDGRGAIAAAGGGGGAGAAGKGGATRYVNSSCCGFMAWVKNKRNDYDRGDNAGVNRE